ncbi:MAG TPA: T9SS type A sorting domain-containing protein, partial [Saprospiraceae bacterium]|nr:T9SS type A sorting domain-containing protein [Saprospiraceae bacterium]
IWDSIHTGIRADARNVYFVNDQTGFISTYHPGYKLYRTTNGFQSWDSVYSMSNTSSFYFVNESTGYVYDSYTKLKTTNSGLNWFTVQLPTNSIYFNAIGTGFATGMTGEIFKTTNNGLNWDNYTNTVYSGGLLNDIFAVNENMAYIACDYGKILKTTNGGSVWNTFEDQQTESFNSLHFLDENTGIAGVLSNNPISRIKRTTNGGVNWYSAIIEPVDQITDIDFPDNSNGFAVSKVGYFTRSSDGGESWLAPVFISPIWSGDIKFINSNTGFWVGENIIRKTTNSGSNWVETVIDSLNGFSCIDFVDLNTGFVTAFSQPNGNYEGAILKTTNSGLNWARTDLPVTRIYEIKITENEVVYAVCDGGKILKSINMGSTWSIYQSCYAGTLLSMDFTNSLTGYAAGMNGTIIKTTTGGGDPIGIEPINNSMPSEFRLYLNYPNPFNPVTKIKFSIPLNSQNDPVNIFVYDITGREVKSYQLGGLKAGIYSVDFDGTNLASGVYFYSLATNRFNQTNKMVLLK